jgi:hypothetical protein
MFHAGTPESAKKMILESVSSYENHIRVVICLNGDCFATVKILEATRGGDEFLHLICCLLVFRIPLKLIRALGNIP